MYEHTIRNNEVVLNFVINEYKAFLYKKIQEIIQYGKCAI
jgi:hypothetical protein